MGEPAVNIPCSGCGQCRSRSNAGRAHEGSPKGCEDSAKESGQERLLTGTSELKT